MSNGQNRRAPKIVKRVAIVGAASLLGTLLLAPSPGSADPSGQAPSHSAPTITEVQHRLDTLNRQAEVASEAYNTAHVRMNQAHQRLTGLQADVDRQRSRVSDLRTQIVRTALSDYQSTGGLSTSAAFLVSKDPSQFINSLATSAVIEHQESDLLTQLKEQQNQLGLQEQQAKRELVAITAEQKQMAAHKASVEKNLKAARDLLGHLQEKERLRLLALQRQQTQTTTTTTSTPSRGSSRPPATPAPPASGRAAVAVSTALAQLGKPYVWAAAGPDAFDCSGLTMYAWAAAGVSLSHSATIQSQQGVPVAISDLQPGDLVFYYSPVSHVGMYIGNGNIVHAPHTGSVVQIVPLNSMPIAWARRVG